MLENTSFKLRIVTLDSSSVPPFFVDLRSSELCRYRGTWEKLNGEMEKEGKQEEKSFSFHNFAVISL